VSKLPASYRTQPACATCAHAFIRSEYDEGDDYFCALGAPPRPSCCSVYMNEYRRHEDGDDYAEHLARSGAEREAWMDWSALRHVNPWDICDEYAARETGNGGGE
jgi:hypothetical protein